MPVAAPYDLAPRPPELPPARSPEEIRRLAEAIFADRVFTAGDAPGGLIPLMFMPIGFGALHGWPAELLKQVVAFGVIGEHHTLGMTINGCPIFTEFALWRTDDFLQAARVAKAAIASAKAALDAAMDPTEPPEETS